MFDARNHSPTRLSARHAFVVQLDQMADPLPERLLGRIEHVLTGVTQQFESLAEMYEFMGQSLRQAQVQELEHGS